ncbi:MAG: ATP-binding protein [Phycisphaerales bacterium]|nr:ATP-binding protein [Phycisphaerales bacterium]
MTRTFHHDVEARLVSSTRQLEEQIHDHLLVSATAMARRLFDAPMSDPRRFSSSIPELTQFAYELLQAVPPALSRFDLEAWPELQAIVDGSGQIDSRLAYAMVWTEDGNVIAHSKRELLHTSLSSTLWPALEPQQPQRVVKLNVPAHSKDPRVLEATVSLKLKDANVAYVSAAYPQGWLESEFWRIQGRTLVYAAMFTLAGLVVIFLFTHFVIARMDRRRREIRQTAQARTSLLAERGMLASVLAHEVRSPLTALRFNLHSLRGLVAAYAAKGRGGSGDTDRQLVLTDRCEREIRRLDGMLNDFLQRTQVIGPVEAAAVNTVVNEAIEFLRSALERRNIQISIHLDSSSPAVHVHPDELRQVILNLAANAHEAMPKGGMLAVSTVAEDAPNEHRVTILLRDSGGGIPPDLHERIFEPFFSTKPNGSGLGLALVRRVVSGAGGTVFCESVVGEGTTFRIVLPRAHEGSEAQVSQAGRGYAHVRRDEPAIELEDSPEIVIDQQDQKLEARSQKPEVL